MKIFATRVWAFDPWKWPVVIFGRDGDRVSLVRRAEAGDRLVFVATQDKENVAPQDRGRLLGIVEFGLSAVQTSDFVRPENMRECDLDAQGQVKWPVALPIERAWRFVAKPRVLDVLRKQLPRNATSQAVLLDEVDAAAVRALEVEEVPLPSSPRNDAPGRLVEASAPSRGPVPSDTPYEVTKPARKAAFTYCFRYGKSDVWKPGWTGDVPQRLREVNQHVPVEVTGESWSAVLQQGWDDPHRAYEMEQRLFAVLAPYRTTGERVTCSEKVLRTAWFEALRG